MKNILVHLLLLTLLVGCASPGEPAAPAEIADLPAVPPTATPNPTPTATPGPKFAPTAPALPEADVLGDEIFTAIDQGDLEAVKGLLEGGLAVNAGDKNGTTPVMWAAATGKLDILSYLIEHGGELNKGRASDRSTPLHYALFYHQLETARMLIEAGAELNVGADRGTTPLHIAADSGVIELVKLLLDAGADPNLVTTFGTDALWFALRMEYVPVVQALLEAGADVNAHYAGGQPHPSCPLTMAAWIGNAENIQMLLDRGARDPWLSEVPGFDPFDFTPLDASFVDDKVLVSGGSSPLYVGGHMAQRPWVDPSTFPEDTHGTNFFTWSDSLADEEVLFTIVEDKAGHRTEVKLTLPLFIGAEAVTYGENITRIPEDGPFVTLRVHTAVRQQGKILVQRSEGSTEKAIDAQRTTVFDLQKVTWNEPISVAIVDEAGITVETIEIDCIWRAASANAVFYDLYTAAW